MNEQMFSKYQAREQEVVKKLVEIAEVELNKKTKRELQLKKLASEGEDSLPNHPLEQKPARSEIHNEKTQAQQIEGLSKQACEFLGEYVQTEQKLKDGCADVGKQREKTASLLLGTLSDLGEQFKKCEARPDCKDKMDEQQKKYSATIAQMVEGFGALGISANLKSLN